MFRFSAEPKAENRADGAYSTWTLYSCDGTNAYCGDNLLRNQVQEQQYSASGGQLRYAVQMFDALARAKFAQAPTVSGSVSKVATSYDALGRATSRRDGRASSAFT